LYPHELDKARKFAQKINQPLEMKPLRKRIDFKNKIIIDLIYKIETLPCPFFIKESCSIHENRFIACRKYPFSNWTKSPELFVKLLKFPKFFYEIDTKCTFIKDMNSKIPLNEEIFDKEFEFLKKDIEIFERIENKLTNLNNSGLIELKKENKFKEKYPLKYREIIENWKHIPIKDY
jgi:Fe-S-cluster containining protein